MASGPVYVPAISEDLIELLILLAFVILSSIGGVVKKWMEGREQQERKQSLEKIHEAKKEPLQHPPLRPVRTEKASAPSPLHPALRPPVPTAGREETIPYARPYPEKPAPVLPPRLTRQERLAEIQRKQEEYLRRISGRMPPTAPSTPPRGISADRAVPPTPAAPAPAARHALPKTGKSAKSHAKPAGQVSFVNRRDVLEMLRDKRHLRTAFLLTEILDKPVALRETNPIL
jgi:hypothetical protein